MEMNDQFPRDDNYEIGYKQDDGCNQQFMLRILGGQPPPPGHQTNYAKCRSATQSAAKRKSGAILPKKTTHLYVIFWGR